VLTAFLEVGVAEVKGTKFVVGLIVALEALQWLEIESLERIPAFGEAVREYCDLKNRIGER